MASRPVIPLRCGIKSIGAAGPFETILMRLDRFDIAESRIDRPATRYASIDKEGLPFTDIDGSIGYEILRQFVITFDYRRGELWFERSSAFGTRTGQGSAGFQAVRMEGAGFGVTHRCAEHGGRGGRASGWRCHHRDRRSKHRAHEPGRIRRTDAEAGGNVGAFGYSARWRAAAGRAHPQGCAALSGNAMAFECVKGDCLFCVQPGSRNTFGGNGRPFREA